MQTDLLTPDDVNAIRYLSIGIASFGIVCVFFAGLVLLMRRIEDSQALRNIINTVPGQMYYSRLLLAVPAGVAWIIGRSNASSNDIVCKAAMTVLVFSWNISNGFIMLLGVNVLVLLTKRDPRIAGHFATVGAVFVVITAVTASVVGLALHRFGVMKDGGVCWIIPSATDIHGSHHEQRWSVFKIELLLFYVPMFIYESVAFISVGRVLTGLFDFHGRSKTALQPSQLRDVLFKVGLISSSLAFHSITDLAADLPVRYDSRAAQIIVLLLQFVGFSSYGVVIFLSFLKVSPENKGIVKRILGNKPRPQIAPTDIEQQVGHDGEALTKENFISGMTDLTDHSFLQDQSKGAKQSQKDGQIDRTSYLFKGLLTQARPTSSIAEPVKDTCITADGNEPGRAASERSGRMSSDHSTNMTRSELRMTRTRSGTDQDRSLYFA